MANGGAFLTPQQALAAEQQMRQAQALQQGFSPVSAAAQELGRNIAGAFGSAIGAPMQESANVQLARQRAAAVQSVDPNNPQSYLDAAKQLYSAGDVAGAYSIMQQKPAVAKLDTAVIDIPGNDVQGNPTTSKALIDKQSGELLKVYGTGKKVSGTSIQLNMGQDPFYKALGKGLGESFVEDNKSAENAAQAIRDSKQSIDLLNKGIISGTGANFRLGLARALKTAGIYDNEDVANTDAFFANQGKAVLSLLSTRALGSGTAVSEGDRKFAQDVVGQRVALTADSLRRIIGINQKINKAMIETYNKKAEKVAKGKAVPFPVTVEMPKIPSVEKPTPVDTNVLKPVATDANNQPVYLRDGKYVYANGVEYGQ